MLNKDSILLFGSDLVSFVFVEIFDMNYVVGIFKKILKIFFFFL